MTVVFAKNIYVGYSVSVAKFVKNSKNLLLGK